MQNQINSRQCLAMGPHWLGANYLELSSSRRAWPHMALEVESKPGDTRQSWTMLAVYPSSEWGNSVVQKFCAAIIDIEKWKPRLSGPDGVVLSMTPGVEYMLDAKAPDMPVLRLKGRIRFVGPGSLATTLADEEFASILSGDVDG